MFSRKRTKRRLSVLLTSVALATVTLVILPQVAFAPPGGGGGSETIYDPVILASEWECEDLPEFWDLKDSCNNIPVMMNPNGNAITPIRSPGVSGDLTHAGDPRYVVDFCCDTGGGCTRAGGYVGGSCDLGTEVIIATSDDCVSTDPDYPTYHAVLLDDASFSFYGMARWSPDGQRLAVSANRDGVGWGIFVGEVLFDGLGRPAGLWDGVTLDSYGNPEPNTIRQVSLSYPPFNVDVAPTVSWSGDNVRLTFDLSDPTTGNGDVWVLDVDTGELTNVTNDASEDQRRPSFSPVDNRIVYQQFMYVIPDNPWDKRRDLFIVDLDSQTEFQLTNESNANVFVIGAPEWSPDAQDITFTAGQTFSGSTTPLSMYRIPADGSDNASLLTRQHGTRNLVFGPARWRSTSGACGDGSCDPGEDPCNCPEDCGAPDPYETDCWDGIDNDCDGLVDCEDPDCDGDPDCQEPCNYDGICDPGEDCENCPDCEGVSNGPKSGRHCCGNGMVEGPEFDDPNLCDGNP